MAFSPSTNLGMIHLSRCPRSTCDEASCCHQCLAVPGSNSTGSCMVGRVQRQSTPRGWVESFHAHQLSTCTASCGQSRCVDPIQCHPPRFCRPLHLWCIMASESSQLAQANTLVWTALRKPKPPIAADHTAQDQNSAQTTPQSTVMPIRESLHHFRTRPARGTWIRTVQQESPRGPHVRKHRISWDWEMAK